MAGHPRRKPGPYGEELAGLFREALARRQMTQADLAGRADISRSQLSLYLKAERSPTIEEFIDLCTALDMRPTRVLGDAIYTVDWRTANDRAPQERPTQAELRLVDE